LAPAAERGANRLEIGEESGQPGELVLAVIGHLACVAFLEDVFVGKIPAQFPLSIFPTVEKQLVWMTV
jgi:hypothetical protein